MSKIAIVGAGFAGLSCAYHLQDHDVTVFDAIGIGGGASGAAAGLLHPFPGKHFRKSPEATDAMYEAMVLLNATGAFLQKPIVKIPQSDDEKRKLSKMPLYHANLKWTGEHLVIENGVTVFAKQHLEKLFELSGAKLIREKIEKLPVGFDHTIIAAGWGVREFGIDLPIRFVKGHVAKMKSENFSHSQIGDGYIALSEEKGKVWLGSTYEHDFKDDAIDEKMAEKLLRPKWPEKNFAPLAYAAGVRVTHTKSVTPLIANVAENVTVVTGLGSRGLLYHGLIGKKVAAKVW